MAAEAVRRLGEIGERSFDADLALHRALALSAEPVIRLEAHRDFIEGDLLQFVAEEKLLAIGRRREQAIRWNLRAAGRGPSPRLQGQPGVREAHERAGV